MCIRDRFESHTALLYDVILGMTVSERPEGASPLVDEGGVEQLDFVFPPLEPQFISNGERLPSTISRYWQSSADLTFYRRDASAKAGFGSLISQVFDVFVA